MKTLRALALLLILVVGAGVAYGAASAGWVADSNTPAKLYDHSQLQVHKGVAAINPGGLTWTAYNPILTVTNASNQAMMNARVAIDLDLTSTGFATGATSQTITFILARKIDGTNWRLAANTATTAISGTNSASGSVDLLIGEVGPLETVRVYAKVSSITSLPNVGLPYVFMYRSGVAAVISASN